MRRPIGELKSKQEAKALIDTMSGAQLRVASEFLVFVKRRQIDAATFELLSIPGFEQSFARGMKDIKAGRTKPWRKVRSDGGGGSASSRKPAASTATAAGTPWLTP